MYRWSKVERLANGIHHGGVIVRLPHRFRLLSHLLVATVTASLLTVPPFSPAAAAPRAVPGEGPVDRGLPALRDAQPRAARRSGGAAGPAGRQAGRRAGARSPPRPESDRRAATAQALRADAQLAAPGTPIVRPGYPAR